MKSLELPTGAVSRIGGVSEGFAALVVADLARGPAARTGVLHIACDAEGMEAARQTLAFFAPELEVRTFPAWDCMPYDRVSPSSAVVSQRMETLGFLASKLAGGALAEGAAGGEGGGPRVVLTTVNAALQRIPPRTAVAAGSFVARPGDSVDMAALNALLARDGYLRTGTVREPGEFAVRGGIIDVFPPGTDEPLRLDLFGEVSVTTT